MVLTFAFFSTLVFSQGLAKVQKVFNITGNRAATVAGLIVQNGRLRNKATVTGNADKNAEPGGYVFRVIRGGKVILDEATSADLKRVKNTVHEVRKYCVVFVYSYFYLLTTVRLVPHCVRLL